MEFRRVLFRSIADALADVVLHGIAVEKKPGGKR
jgi:hypothetical protein